MFQLDSVSPHYARIYGDAFDLFRARRALSALSGMTNIDCEGCISGRSSSAQRERVRNYIISRLQKIGLKPEVKKYTHHQYSHTSFLEESTLEDVAIDTPEMDYNFMDLETPFSTSSDLSENQRLKDLELESEVYNVVVEIEGSSRKDEIIELNAHYDTAGEKVPGADDNGSGVVTLLEIAHIYAQSKPQRTIRLVFSDLEESGNIGTGKHVGEIVAKKEKLIGTIVVDTIGYAPIGKHIDVKPSFVVEVGTKGMHSNRRAYQRARSLIEVLAYQFYKYKDRYTSLSIQTEKALPNTADHGQYWGSGVPSLLVSAPFVGKSINPGYHSERDVMPQFNWGYFEGVVKVIVETTALLAHPTEKKEGDVEVIDYYNQVLDESVRYDKSRIPRPRAQPMYYKLNEMGFPIIHGESKDGGKSPKTSLEPANHKKHNPLSTIFDAASFAAKGKKNKSQRKDTDQNKNVFTGEDIGGKGAQKKGAREWISAKARKACNDLGF